MHIAEALRSWLPKIINAVRPWLSSADIDKGARWSVDVARRLEQARVGIVCLTPANLHSDWILFEAGALSKTVQATYVCPLLIDLEPAQISGPLAQFQATRATRGEIMQLLGTINSSLDASALPEQHLEEAFEVWWPKLEEQISLAPAESGSTPPQRSEREILEEILDYVRNQQRVTASFSNVLPDLSDDEQRTLVMARAQRTLMLSGDSINQSTYTSDSERHLISFTGKKNHYSLVLPKSVPLEQVADFALRTVVVTPIKEGGGEDKAGRRGRPGSDEPPSEIAGPGARD